MRAVVDTTQWLGRRIAVGTGVQRVRREGEQRTRRGHAEKARKGSARTASHSQPQPAIRGDRECQRNAGGQGVTVASYLPWQEDTHVNSSPYCWIFGPSFTGDARVQWEIMTKQSIYTHYWRIRYKSLNSGNDKSVMQKMTWQWKSAEAEGERREKKGNHHGSAGSREQGTCEL